MIPLGERLGLFEDTQDFEVRLAQEKLAAEILPLDGAADIGDGPFVEARWMREPKFSPPRTGGAA